MPTRPLLLLAALLALAPALRAQPAPVPPNAATAGKPVADVVAEADALAAKGDHAAALPLYKSAAVRLANDPARAAPVLEKVRQTELKLAPAAPAAPEGQAGAPRTPHPAPTPGETRELTLQKLGNFDYDADAGGDVPADVTALSGSKVKIRGYMIPLDQADKITRFVLVPDLFACCFGQPPSLQHTMTVECPPGKSVKYTADAVDCVGTLAVEEKTEDGFIVSLFQLSVESVKPSPQP